MPSSTSSPQENSTFLGRLFTNNPQNIHDEIHARLNSNQSPTGSSTNMGQTIFESLGFATPSPVAASTSSSSSSPIWEQPRKRVEFETKPVRQYAAPHQRGSYQIHQGNEQIQVDVNVASSLKKEDLKVEVLNMPSCLVQWSTGASNNHSHRLKLGSSVDCQQLSANLHQGVLRMKAPLKTEPEPTTNIIIGTAKE